MTDFRRWIKIVEAADATKSDLLEYGKRNVIETPAFKAWFKDSKVVDKDGKPLVVFHGTQHTDGFESFNTLDSDVGSHFGTIHQAQDFTNVSGLGVPRLIAGSHIIPVYLSIQNPLRMSDLTDWGPRVMLDELDEQGINLRDDELQKLNWSVVKKWRRRDWNRFFVKSLEDRGYDGIVYQNEFEDAGHDSWIAFHPWQIKSAISAKRFDRDSSMMTEGLIKVPAETLDAAVNEINERVLWQVRDRFTPKVRAEFPEHYAAFKELLAKTGVRLPRTKYPMSKDGIDVVKLPFPGVDDGIRLAFDWKGEAIRPNRDENSRSSAGWLASMKVIILHFSDMREFHRFPMKNYHPSNLAYVLNTAKDSLTHELRHAVQSLKLHPDQSKRHTNYSNSSKDYYTSPIEFDPQIGSAVHEFMNDLAVLRDTKQKINLPRMLRRFVGAEKGDMFTTNTNAFFKNLKRHTPQRWKIAVRKFFIEIQKALNSTKLTEAVTEDGINEIYIGYPMDEPEAARRLPTSAEMKKGQVIATVKNDNVWLIEDAETAQIALLKDDKIVSLLRVAKDFVNGLSTVLYTYVDPEYRQQGFMRALIDLWVRKYGALLSDNNQTPQAKEMWQQLMLRPGGLKLSIYNSETDEKKRLTYHDAKPIENPWDDSEELRILAEQRVLTERDQRFMRMSGRGFDGWYGRKTDFNP